MTNSILAFYSGQDTDPHGRTLSGILSFTDDQLEQDHNFIQTLFPLPEPSPLQPAAALVTEDVFSAFRSRPLLRSRLRVAFERILMLWGFRILGQFPGLRLKIVRAHDFAEIADKWASPGVRIDHNRLRISRVIRSLRVLGLEAEALAFRDALKELEASSDIVRRSSNFWDRAAERPLWVGNDVKEEEVEGYRGLKWLKEFAEGKGEGVDGRISNRMLSAPISNIESKATLSTEEAQKSTTESARSDGIPISEAKGRQPELAASMENDAEIPPTTRRDDEEATKSHPANGQAVEMQLSVNEKSTIASQADSKPKDGQSSSMGRWQLLPEKIVAETIRRPESDRNETAAEFGTQTIFIQDNGQAEPTLEEKEARSDTNSTQSLDSLDTELERELDNEIEPKIASVQHTREYEPTQETNIAAETTPKVETRNPQPAPPNTKESETSTAPKEEIPNPKAYDAHDHGIPEPETTTANPEQSSSASQLESAAAPPPNLEPEQAPDREPPSSPRNKPAGEILGNPEMIAEIEFPSRKLGSFAKSMQELREGRSRIWDQGWTRYYHRVGSYRGTEVEEMEDIAGPAWTAVNAKSEAVKEEVEGKGKGKGKEREMQAGVEDKEKEEKVDVVQAELKLRTGKKHKMEVEDQIQCEGLKRNSARCTRKLPSHGGTKCWQHLK